LVVWFVLFLAAQTPVKKTKVESLTAGAAIKQALFPYLQWHQ
jgi:hypothetical protein